MVPLIDVLILQHPLESHHAKGSARLLHLGLPGSRLVVGETFDQVLLQGLLSVTGSVLLYPDSPDPALAAPPVKRFDDSAPKQLVVLDATWRKSRKMLYANPALQALPRLALNDAVPSRYLIRRAHALGQLSTLEATCHALSALEQDAQKYLPMLAGFDGFVAQQAAYALNRRR